MGRFGVLAGLRRRVPVVLVAVLALASPLGAVSSASSAQAVSLQTLSLSAPATAETRVAFTLSGYGSPIRTGRLVIVQRLSGSSWIEVARTTEASTGRYAASTSVATAGKFTFRAVASAWLGAASVASVSRAVAVHVPCILLTPSTAIPAETVKATGTLPGVYSRPVWVQRKSGTAWLTVAKATSTTRGVYSTSFHALAAGSYSVRSLAPKVTIAGKVRAQYVTAAKTLRVVAQTATLTLPGPMVQASTGLAIVTSAPVRAGRAVTLQVQTSGVWTTKATGSQSGTGAASFTITAGTPGSYSYRAWTPAAAGAPAFASATKTLSVRPPPVTTVTATPASSSMDLSWVNPVSTSVTGVTIRRNVGGTAPVSPTSGTPVGDVLKPATVLTDTGLTPGTQYSYALFAHDGTLVPVYATAATVTSTTVPDPVTAVTAIPSSTSVALSWVNPAAGSLSGVMIRRLPGVTPPALVTEGDLVSDQAATPTTFTDTSLVSGTQYSYAVFAHNSTPLYAAAAAVSTTTAIAQVTDLVATPASTSIALSWTNPSAVSLTGVMVRRLDGATPPASATDGFQVGSLTAPANTVTDGSLTPGAQYSYALFAHDGTPLYATATTITSTTISGPVTSPVAVRASTSIDLSWVNPPAASLTGVMVRRLAGATPPASAAAGFQVGDVVAPATTITDSSLTPGAQYSYAFFAHDGTPLYSVAATVTSTTLPDPVSSVAAVPASTSIAFSWTSPQAASVTGVMIRRLAGATPPASPTDGVLVSDVGSPATTYTDTGLTAETRYSYALFAHDATSGYSSAVTVTRTTSIRAFTVSTGESHSCALTAGGGVKCWGSNASGVLGDGTTAQSSVPVNVVGLGTGSHALAVSAGSHHTCAVTSAGAVTCWGQNSFGGLGDGSTTDSPVPVGVSGLTSGVTAVSAGNDFTCAVTGTGGVRCWGSNAHGELGDGTTGDSSVPVAVTGLGSGVDSVSAGGSHACAVTSGGAVKCWGLNFDGQLGNNTNNESTTPVDVSGLGSGVDSVSAGAAHTCAVTSLGGVKCWGYNGSGKLGDGTLTSSPFPVDVVGLESGAVAVSAGQSHTCAVTSPGGVQCWGYNGYGQLGDSTTDDHPVPADVSGPISGAAGVSAGGNDSCAVTSVGEVSCWGNNGGGELGDGTTTNSAVPVRVAGLG
jgi:alpha-tubulin suppressor-like RCC1 family protein